MFPFRLTFGTAFVLFASLVLALFGCITAGAVVLTWAFGAVAVLGLLMIREPERRMRSIGLAALAVVGLGVVLAFSVASAHASAATAPDISAPPGDTTFWSGLNVYLAEILTVIVGSVATWALKEVATHTRIKIRADQEAQIRETMKTGAFAAMGEMEVQLDHYWTPAQRRAVIVKVVDWAQDRAAAQLGKLGLPGFVVNAMASKVVGEVLSAYPFIEAGAGPISAAGHTAGAISGN